tara:strand:+ start:114 stop:617 length:504 start_codon:yes stop_codon:yes gene_type:complete
MEDTISYILEKIKFKKKDMFEKLLLKILAVAHEDTKTTYSTHDNIVFRTSVLFAGFSPFHNELGKNKKYEAGVHALRVICDELLVEVEDSELFILFHIRELGKFRKKESDLLKELKSIWGQYSAYKIEDCDFSYALKNLMRLKFIEYRKGNLHLNKNIIVRYRNERF